MTMKSRALKIAAAALNTTPLDWEGNLAAAVRAVRMAKEAEADMVVLPELCLSGAGCEDAFLAPFVCTEALDSLRSLVPECRGIAAAVGLPLRADGHLYAAAAVIEDGQLMGFAAQSALPSGRLSYAARWFSPWTPSTSAQQVTLDGRAYPIARVFRLCGADSALSVGGEAWRREDLLGEGIDVCLDLSARPFSFGEQARFEAALARLSARGIAAASANLCGNEAGQIIYGGGAAVAVGGTIAARSFRFSFGGVSLALAAEGSAAQAAPDPLSSKNEEFSRAVALGLFDYLRKTWSRAFALSLSGGADSAAVACLVRLMARYGVRELGSAGFASAIHWEEAALTGGISWNPGGSEAALEACLDALMPRLLTTVYQGTANSSETTRRAAAAVARDVGSRHAEFSIDELVALYRERAEGVTGRRFSWGTDDLTLQNIQARVRGPGIWMVANAENALLLTTGNRSEAAVGYATMDGDTCGGLAPIVGVDKAWLREWLKWLERSAPSDARPFPSLKLINSQAPTAELRPLEAKQTDEGDLMPYALLDEIERLAVHELNSPKETLSALSARHPQLDRTYLQSCVARFFRMFARSQWKRNRCAPGFHLDEADLSPASWCRFPVLSGGFSREIGRMDGAKSGKIEQKP